MTADTSLDWRDIDFVAFDVDGTLYDQRKLRLLVAWDLLRFSLSRADLTTPRVLRSFRIVRERLADEEAENFEPLLVRETAAATGIPLEMVEAIVERWMMQRPLRYLAQCRYPAVDVLFEGLRRAGKVVGILSDYPAHDKLKALGLHANHVVAAGDPGIGQLKPHPRGLQALMAAAGAPPKRTLLIGDRYERDGAAAQRAGVRYLIRTLRAASVDFPAFRRFDDAIFAPVLV